MKAVVFDTESTGFKEPVVPLQLVYMPIKQELNKFQPWKLGVTEEMFDPERSIEYGAMAAHGIRPEKVKGLQPWREYRFPLMPEYFIGHNVDYDVANIAPSFPEKWDYKTICTLALARLVFPQVDSHKLSALAYFMLDHGLVPEKYERIWETYIKGAHEAEADVHMCCGLLIAITKLLKLETWEQAYKVSEIGRIPLDMPFGKHKGEAIRDMPSGFRSYKSWLAGQSDVDPYLMKAITMDSADWRAHMCNVESIRRRIEGGV